MANALAGRELSRSHCHASIRAREDLRRFAASRTLRSAGSQESMGRPGATGPPKYNLWKMSPTGGRGMLEMRSQALGSVSGGR
jgi:hypothetical protein